MAHVWLRRDTVEGIRQDLPKCSPHLALFHQSACHRHTALCWQTAIGPRPPKLEHQTSSMAKAKPTCEGEGRGAALCLLCDLIPTSFALTLWPKLEHQTGSMAKAKPTCEGEGRGAALCLMCDLIPTSFALS